MARRKTKETRLVEKVFGAYFPDCPRKYPPEAYRYDSTSIRLRIVNERFKSMERSERFDLIDPIIDTLPKRTQSELIRVLLLAPDEVERSAGNYEFEHPTPEPRVNQRKDPARR